MTVTEFDLSDDFMNLSQNEQALPWQFCAILLSFRSVGPGENRYLSFYVFREILVHDQAADLPPFIDHRGLVCKTLVSMILLVWEDFAYR